MRKLIALFLCGTLAVSSTVFATLADDGHCRLVCMGAEIRMSMYGKYGEFIFTNYFDYICQKTGGDGCPYSAVFEIYKATPNDPNYPWTRVYQYWWNDTGVFPSTAFTSCGDSSNEMFEVPGTYTFTPGIEYQMEFKVYNGDFNDAKEGLLPLFCGAVRNITVPIKTGGG